MIRSRAGESMSALAQAAEVLGTPEGRVTSRTFDALRVLAAATGREID
jgi:hypothetical protein